MKKIISTIFIILFTVVSMAANHNVLADSAYNRDQFGEAIMRYTSILDSCGPSSDVYYNLGNAHYRHGNLAGAVLNYERSLRIDPTNEDARANLNFVNSRLQDRPEDNNSLFTRLHQSVVASATANTWAWVSLFTFVALCAAVALYIFSGNITMRKIGFFGAIILIILAIYFIVVASDASSRINDRSEAIVTAPSTMLNSTPRQPKQTEKVVPLHEGTKVEIIDSVSTPDDPVSPRYYKVRINGSTPAWLRATDVEII
ncbi:MAG: tetratricopeptide repeat protein [Odoribacter sp.]|nr:tetratricopeptide repeat protein [Odoribacter sp.]